MKKIKKAGKYFMTVLLVATLLFTWCAQSTVTVSAASKATYTIKKITQKKKKYRRRRPQGIARIVMQGRKPTVRKNDRRWREFWKSQKGASASFASTISCPQRRTSTCRQPKFGASAFGPETRFGELPVCRMKGNGTVPCCTC